MPTTPGHRSAPAHQQLQALGRACQRSCLPQLPPPRAAAPTCARRTQGQIAGTGSGASATIDLSMQAWQKGRSWAIPIQLSTAWLSLAGCHLPRSARADGIVVTCKEAPQRDLGQESAVGCRLAFQAPRVPDRAAAGPMMRVVAGDDMSAGGPDDLTATCPFTVERPVMRQRWERLTFLHWPFEPADVQRLLPAGLAVDTFDGRAWVGLVPFFMHVASAGGQQAPWASRFCETNVRTYVRDAAGRPGIWFFSLDAARLGAVAVARATYGLPYYWSAMRLAEDGEQIT